jgi:hypothetical protein
MSSQRSQDNQCVAVLAQSDITSLSVDVIVNAANTELKRGSGVCGSIFKAAGRGLDAACAALNGCPTGEAVLTEPFGIRHVKGIVHAVGPHVTGSPTAEQRQQLATCYARSMDVSSQRGLSSIVWPLQVWPLLNMNFRHFHALQPQSTAFRMKKRQALRYPQLCNGCIRTSVHQRYLNFPK